MARPEEDIREGVERSSVFHFPDRRSDWQDSRFKHFLYSVSVLRTNRSESTPHISSRLPLLPSIGHFEYLFVLFSLTNAPSTFQTLMNSLWNTKPSFPDNLIVVKSWLVPKNVKTLQSFFGFVNFYRRFIRFFLNCSAFDKVADKRRCFWQETWVPRCFWSTQRPFSPWSCPETPWSLPAYTNRGWLFWLSRCCCVEPRTSWWLASCSLSIKDNEFCRTKLDDSRTRTAPPDVCFEDSTCLEWR